MLTVIDSGAWLGALVIIGAIVGWIGRLVLDLQADERISLPYFS